MKEMECEPEVIARLLCKAREHRKRYARRGMHNLCTQHLQEQKERKHRYKQEEEKKEKHREKVTEERKRGSRQSRKQKRERREIDDVLSLGETKRKGKQSTRQQLLSLLNRKITQRAIEKRRLQCCKTHCKTSA